MPKPMRRSALLHEPRNDGVKRTFARRQHVRVLLVEREERPAILQREAGPGRHESAAKALVDALDQRHDVAVAIDRRQVDRVAAVPRRHAVDDRRFHARRRGLRANQPRPRPGRRLVEQLADRHGAKPGIGDVLQHVRVGQLLGFDHHVKRGRAREAVLAKRKLFHQVEHHQCGDALRVRRDLVDAPVAIGG